MLRLLVLVYFSMLATAWSAPKNTLFSFQTLEKKLENVSSKEAFVTTLNKELDLLLIETAKFKALTLKDENLFKNIYFQLTDYYVDLDRFQTLLAKQTPCSQIRPGLIFSFSPMNPNPEEQDIPETMKNIFKLIPYYCNL